MKFAVVLVLALCLPAIIYAQLSCASDEFVCSLENNWRSSIDVINNDDDAISQEFDWQVEGLEEVVEFSADLQTYLANPTATNQNIARTSCKEAIPDRVYNIRFERQNKDDNYKTSYYIYRGYKPSNEAWDRYCRIYVDDGIRDHMVESKGDTKEKLKGSFSRTSEGLMVNTNEDEGECNARFRPKKLVSQCLVKNENRRFPTEWWCATQGNLVQTGLAGVAETSIFDDCHQWGGSRSHIRWGCQQYTWDSDTNDDNLETSQCERMYFVNDYSGMDAFKLGQLPGAGTGSIALNRQTLVTTPDNGSCEYKVPSVGFNDFAGIEDHKCQ